MILTPEQKEFLGRVVKGDWSINTENGLIDVSGDVIIFTEKSIENSRLPVSFGKVTGYFNASKARLTNLEGYPYWVGGNFSCDYNNITSLKYAPKYLMGGVYVWVNPLKELDWNPEYIGGELCICLDTVEDRHKVSLIGEIEALIEKGVKLHKPKKYYYPYTEVYYNNKLIELI